MSKRLDFKSFPDVAMTDSELDNAMRLLRNGEITQDDFAWVVGWTEDEKEIPFKEMTPAQKRRYFAHKRQNDLFAKPKKVRMTRLAKAKALFAKPEYWTGNQTDVSP